jgi:succinate-acetate transporter protein
MAQRTVDVRERGGVVEEPATGRALSGEVIADPGPLGLAAFAATTFTLSVFNAHIIANAKLETVVLPLAFVYGGLVQLLAGMWEFRKGNTFGALAFSSYGAFWLSFAGYVRYVAGALPANDAHEATGLFLLVWAIFTAYMLVASLRTSGAVAAVFLALTVTFILLTIGQLGQHPSIIKAGGWAGLVTAVLAWYASFAGVTNATWGETVLPMYPLARRPLTAPR